MISIKNLSKSYKLDNGEEVKALNNINLEVKQGETIALVGNSGGGKSTVVNLIPRFYDVTGGELLINGVNVKEVPQKELPL